MIATDKDIIDVIIELKYAYGICNYYNYVKDKWDIKDIPISLKILISDYLRSEFSIQTLLNDEYTMSCLIGDIERENLD